MPTLDDLDAAFADLESRAPVPGAVGRAPVRAGEPRRARTAVMLLSAAAVVALTVGVAVAVPHIGADPVDAASGQTADGAISADPLPIVSPPPVWRPHASRPPRRSAAANPPRPPPLETRQSAAGAEDRSGSVPDHRGGRSAAPSGRLRRHERRGGCRNRFNHMGFRVEHRQLEHHGEAGHGHRHLRWTRVGRAA